MTGRLGICLIGIVCSVSGCAVHLYSGDLDKPLLSIRNRQIAANAWRMSGNTPGTMGMPQEMFEHFAKGWREGFYDVVTGRNGDPPALPPASYRKLKFRTPAGSQMADTWFAGFRQGAASAFDVGANQFSRIRTSTDILLGDAATVEGVASAGEIENSFDTSNDSPLDGDMLNETVESDSHDKSTLRDLLSRHREVFAQLEQSVLKKRPDSASLNSATRRMDANHKRNQKIDAKVISSSTKLISTDSQKLVSEVASGHTAKTLQVPKGSGPPKAFDKLRGANAHSLASAPQGKGKSANQGLSSERRLDKTNSIPKSNQSGLALLSSHASEKWGGYRFTERLSPHFFEVQQETPLVAERKPSSVAVKAERSDIQLATHHQPVVEHKWTARRKNSTFSK